MESKSKHKIVQKEEINLPASTVEQLESLLASQSGFAGSPRIDMVITGRMTNLPCGLKGRVNQKIELVIEELVNQTG